MKGRNSRKWYCMMMRNQEEHEIIREMRIQRYLDKITIMKRGNMPNKEQSK